MMAGEPVEKIVWSKPPDMPEIEVLAVENSRRLWRIYHEAYTICAMHHFLGHEGQSEWHYRNRPQITRQKSLMLMEPGEIHRTDKLSGCCTFEVVQIKPDFVERLAGEMGHGTRPHLRHVSPAHPRLYQTYVAFFTALAGDTTGLERQSLLARCLGGMMAHCSERGLRCEPRPARSALRRARDYLHEHCMKQITLADLSEVAGLSRFHFLRMFAQQFGVPPHVYQINLRIERVRRLVKAGFPLALIEAGFADQSHLIRHFKKVMGVTPGQYAAMVR